MLTIFNPKTKGIAYYDYEDIYEGMKDGDRNLFFKKLYLESKESNIHAYCSCIPEKKIPLVISKNKNTYYIKRQDSDVEHSPSCKFDGNYEIPEKGWSIDEKGDVQVFLEHRMHSIKEYDNPLIKEKLSLHEFVKRFLGYSWEIQTKQAIRYDRPPMQFDRYFNSIYHIAGKIKLSDSTTLKDLMGYSKKHAFDLIKKRQRMFVLMLLDKKEKYEKDESFYLLKLHKPDGSHLMEFLCLKTEYDKQFSNLDIKKVPIVVSGFVELNYNDPMIFKHIVFLPISSNGVVVNTNNERKLFNRLHLNNRHFVNSYETFIGFNLYQPDVLLLDVFPKKIIEIFEKKDDLEYLKFKDNKISYFAQIDSFNVQIWDAVNNERIYFI